VYREVAPWNLQVLAFSAMSVPTGNKMDKHAVNNANHIEASNTEMPLALEKANSRVGGGPKPRRSNDRKVSS